MLRYIGFRDLEFRKRIMSDLYILEILVVVFLPGKVEKSSDRRKITLYTSRSDAAIPEVLLVFL